MQQYQSPHKIKRWSAAWIAGIAIHLAVISVIAWHLIPDELVHISQTVPMPNATVELMPAQGIEPAVFFTSKPDHLNAEAAELYRIHDDGTRYGPLLGGGCIGLRQLAPMIGEYADLRVYRP